MWQKYGTVFNAFTAPQVQTSSPAPAPARNYAAIQRTVDEEILAVCPLCNFEVTIFESQLGQEITCPLCKEKVVIKEEKPTLCPFCNQEIARNAEVCRHCHKKISAAAVEISKYNGILKKGGFNLKEIIGVLVIFVILWTFIPILLSHFEMEVKTKETLEKILILFYLIAASAFTLRCKWLPLIKKTDLSGCPKLDIKGILQKAALSVKEVLWVILIFIALIIALHLLANSFAEVPKAIAIIKDKHLLFLIYPIIAIIFLFRKILFTKKNKTENQDAVQTENAAAAENTGEVAPAAPAEVLQAACPHCNAIFEVEAEWQGLESECSECGKTFVIDIKK